MYLYWLAEFLKHRIFSYIKNHAFNLVIHLIVSSSCVNIKPIYELSGSVIHANNNLSVHYLLN